MQYNDKIRTGVVNVYQIPVYYDQQSLPGWLLTFVQSKQVKFVNRPNPIESNLIDLISVQVKGLADIGRPGDFIIQEQNKIKILHKENI